MPSVGSFESIGSRGAGTASAAASSFDELPNAALAVAHAAPAPASFKISRRDRMFIVASLCVVLISYDSSVSSGASWTSFLGLTLRCPSLAFSG